MEALDRALDAQPNRPRTLAFLVLAGVWWAPNVTYVRYFAALPFDAAGRCNCSDPALLPAAGAGGAGCCPADPAGGSLPGCAAATLAGDECAALTDSSGNPCASTAKGGCASSTCVLCGAEGRACEADGSTLAAEFGLVCEDTAQIGMLGVLGYLGAFVGSFVGSSLSDSHGRQRCTAGGQLCAGAFTLLAALSPSFSLYALLQLANGCAGGASNVAGFTLAAELSGPNNRTTWSVTVWSCARPHPLCPNSHAASV